MSLFSEAVNFFLRLCPDGPETIRRLTLSESLPPPYISMGDYIHLSQESDSVSATESASYTGAFFPNSRHLVVAGGTFTSHNVTETVPSDFLRLPLGSIDLRNEIQLDKMGGVVCRHCERRSVRRMYSARVAGHNRSVTVALYQGDDAEEEWRQDVVRHSVLRHPNILQIYATAKLTPPEYADERDAYKYYTLVLSTSKLRRRFWIRRSTGRLSIEFTRHDTDPGFPLRSEVLPPPESMMTLRHPNQEALVIASVELQQWYLLCYHYLTRRKKSYIPVQAEIKLGSIICWRSGRPFEDTTEIASVVDPDITCSGWYHSQLGRLEDSSSRYNSAEVVGSTIYLRYLLKYKYGRCVPWLSQANYIFRQLQIVAHHEDYVLVDCIRLSIQISAPTESPPKGYLFLCSPIDFKTGPTSFRWPDYPAYWSLDPSGSNPLSLDEASNLGFPFITIRTEVRWYHWDETVYDGMRKFHHGKGFDPESQDVADYLDCPLYELTVPIPDGKVSVPDKDSALDRDERSDNSSSAYNGNFKELTRSSADSVEHTQEFPTNEAIITGNWSLGGLVELVKLGLIIALAVITLYEHVQ
ncbi:hypothetical protein MSAN_02000300 [Mycena sanguinolenta]|uniref:Uncharacterized protein n=1 Tax=Mycena sanguinolenta TaxID=230812 RepID=A0A8H6XKT7_9AGAR|nr:hypothetical protein MSAN_02000300 [Mycena sanguinolenta]